MTTQELIDTMRIAAESINNNIPLKMLLIMAADKLEEYV